jgi:hypothetical protein
LCPSCVLLILTKTHPYTDQNSSLTIHVGERLPPSLAVTGVSNNKLLRGLNPTPAFFMLEPFLKTDVKTAQRSMRHARNTTMLDVYAQTEMDELNGGAAVGAGRDLQPRRWACGVTMGG